PSMKPKAPPMTFPHQLMTIEPSRQEPQEPVAPQFVAALLILAAVYFGAGLHAIGNVDQPGLVGPSAAAEAGIALVVGQVEAVGVVARDTAQAIAVVVVPADEVHGVVEAGAARPAPAGRALVVVPGAVERLRVAVRGRRPRPGDEAEDALAGRLGARRDA